MAIRLAKAIADAGICSRRQADKLIAEGRVHLNGNLQTSPAITVTDADHIEVDGTPLPRTDILPRLFMYHKPAGIMCTTDDPQGRPTVFDKLPKNLPRLILVGRLDLNSEGLLLLTTSGELAGKLMHPDSNLERAYKVRFRGYLTDKTIETMRNGVTIDGMHYRPMDVEVLKGNEESANQWAIVTLTEGKNREIRNVFEYFSLQVNRLIRLSYGGFELGNMPTNKLMEVPAKVVASLIDEVK